jgi:hypothetical protein
VSPGADVEARGEPVKVPSRMWDGVSPCSPGADVGQCVGRNGSSSVRACVSACRRVCVCVCQCACACACVVCVLRGLLYYSRGYYTTHTQPSHQSESQLGGCSRVLSEGYSGGTQGTHGYYYYARAAEPPAREPARADPRLELRRRPPAYRVLTGYSAGTQRVLTANEAGTHGVPRGDSTMGQPLHERRVLRAGVRRVGPILGADVRRGEPILSTDERRGEPILGADARRGEPILSTDVRRGEPILGCRWAQG